MGTIFANKSKGNHIITTTIEHPSILEPCKSLIQKNIDIDYLSVDKKGQIDLNQLDNLVKPETILVSVMMVNNETGCILPIKEIGELLKGRGIIFHTDATQAYGKLDLSVKKMNADLVTLSAHKIYGPKGIGCLYIRKGTKLENIMFGGSQEGGRRPGTENIVSILGFSEAVEQLVVQRYERKSIAELRDKLEVELKLRIPQIKINGNESPRVGTHSNIYFPFISGDAMLMKLDMLGIAVSIGSACSSGSPLPSHVLTAMTLEEKRVLNSVRFSLGRFTTEPGINRVIEIIDNIDKQNINRMTENDV
jgi:cysteine desulfurase